MRKKIEPEVLRAAGVKAIRTAIRLRHTQLIDREINERVPAFEDEFDQQLLRGKMMGQREINELVAEILNGE